MIGRSAGSAISLWAVNGWFAASGSFATSRRAALSAREVAASRAVAPKGSSMRSSVSGASERLTIDRVTRRRAPGVTVGRAASASIHSPAQERITSSSSRRLAAISGSGASAPIAA